MFQEIADLDVALKQSFHPSAQFSVTGTSALQKASPFADRQLEGFCKDLYVTIRRLVH
jgi:hypothetical protein